MRTRIAAAVSAAVAAGFTAAVAPGAQAGAGTPGPLDPDAAAALVSAAPAVASGSTLRRVTAAEALAAASTPGASVSVAPGLSLQQAVGASATRQAPAGAVATASPACWANAAWRQWGTWPYEQKITDTTYWCAVYGVRITYRSSTTTAGGTLCGVSWRSSQLVAGGIGYSWFTIRASAGFACPTVIPWVTLHPSHYEDTARNAWGGTSAVGSG